MYTVSQSDILHIQDVSLNRVSLLREMMFAPQCSVLENHLFFLSAFELENTGQYGTSTSREKLQTHVEPSFHIPD